MNKEWLDSDPPAHEVEKNADGSRYIPIRVVEELLDEYTGLDWSSDDFKWAALPLDGGVYWSGSIELLYFDPSEGGRMNQKPGAATIFSGDYPGNKDWLPTLLSECIKNAAKKIGRRFGRYLNDDKSEARQRMQPVRTKPDAQIMKDYMEAVSRNDKDTIDFLVRTYEINT